MSSIYKESNDYGTIRVLDSVISDIIIEEIKKDFMLDLANSEELERSKFENRSIVMKAKESVSRLFSPLL